MREALSKEAKIHGDDAFALLEYLGAESAGSLVLLPPDKDFKEPGGLRPLSDEEITRRIRNLPRATLGSGAPKRMSLAGAQNKLLVVYRDDALVEPIGSEPSTHILEPNHVSDDSPASVINEYVVMSLATTSDCQFRPSSDATRPSRFISSNASIAESIQKVAPNAATSSMRVSCSTSPAL